MVQTTTHQYRGVRGGITIGTHKTGRVELRLPSCRPPVRATTLPAQRQADLTSLIDLRSLVKDMRDIKWLVTLASLVLPVCVGTAADCAFVALDKQDWSKQKKRQHHI